MNSYLGDKSCSVAGQVIQKGFTRKIFPIVAALVMMVAVTACSSSEKNTEETSTSDSLEVVVTEHESSQQTSENATEETTGEETTVQETTVQETTTQETTAPSSDAHTVFQFDETGETKYAYLTFDDGPSENTYPILDILDQYGVKATFFTIGKTDEQSVERYKAIADRGHALGMHSYTHDYSQIYASPESFQEDVQGIHDWLYQVTGQDVRLYRFPGGSSNTVSKVDIHTLIDYVTSQGYIYYDWNVSSGDASSKPVSAEEMIANIMSQSEGYSRVRVLMHDSNPKTETVRALPGIIENLQNAGYQIVPIMNTTRPIQHVKADYMQQ